LAGVAGAFPSVMAGVLATWLAVFLADSASGLVARFVLL
jgi:hypothetical protein